MLKQKTNLADQKTQTAAVYQQVLGAEWDQLSEVLKKLHGVGLRQAYGSLSIRRGKSVFLKILLGLFRFPKTALNTRCTVTFTPSSLGETLSRQIGSKIMRSHQSALSPYDAPILKESFGPLAIYLRNELKPSQYGTALWQYSTHTRWLGVPLPGFLSVRVIAVEFPINDHEFRCHIYTAVPFFGKLLRYQGRFSMTTEAITPERHISNTAKTGPVKTPLAS